MHSHANRAGYLELGGCTIGDMLLRLVLSFISVKCHLLTHFAIATSSRHAPSARLPIRHLVYLQFVARVPWVYVASAIARWVGFNSQSQLFGY
jgi:hypothetical protein